MSDGQVHILSRDIKRRTSAGTGAGDHSVEGFGWHDIVNEQADEEAQCGVEIEVKLCITVWWSSLLI